VAPIAEEGAPAFKPPRPPAARADAGAAPAAKKKGPSLLLVGGVLGLLFLAGVAVLGLIWLQQRRGASVTPSAPPRAPATTVASQPEPAATPDAPPTLRGTLHVESVPPGATVTMDGETLGITPLDVSELAMGTHEVRIELRGHQPETQTFELTPEQPTAELEWTLKPVVASQGTADITSTPPGALVRIDGVSAGQTPVRNHRLRAGNHSLEVTADGYERWTGNLAVREGRRTPLQVALKPIPKAVPTPAADVVDPNRIYARSEVDKEPVRTFSVSANYPYKELKGKKELSVGGTFVVNEKGEVSDIQIEQSGGALVDQAVMAAVAKWKYSPGEKKGTKVKVRMAFMHTFKGN
jgi:TonB family protein